MPTFHKPARTVAAKTLDMGAAPRIIAHEIYADILGGGNVVLAGMLMPTLLEQARAIKYPLNTKEFLLVQCLCLLGEIASGKLSIEKSEQVIAQVTKRLKATN